MLGFNEMRLDAPRSTSVPLILAAIFFCIPTILTFLYPISFWLGTDYEPLGLANALNMAFRLADHQMYAAFGLTNHPGIPFYLMSWLALALTGFPVASGGLEFFNAVISQVQTYHTFLVCLCALAGAAGVYLFVRSAQALAPAPVVIVGLLMWLLSSPSSVMTFMSPGMESFAILINGLFLAVLMPLAFEEKLDPSVVVFAGFVGAIAYLNKLSYIYVPLAFGAAIFFKALLSGIGFFRAALLFSLFLFSLASVVLTVAYLIIGWNEFLVLLDFHRSVILGSGMYGAGDQTVVSSAEILQAIAEIGPGRAYALPIAIVGGSGIAAVGLLTAIKRPREAPIAVFTIAAGIAAAISGIVVIKHYAFHYTAGASATLPACVVSVYLLARAWSYKIGPVQLAVPMLAIFLMAPWVWADVNYKLSGGLNNSRFLQADLEDITAHVSGINRVVDFAYRTPFAQYGEGFIINFANIPRLTYEYLTNRTGVTNSLTEHLITEDVRAYVIDKNYFRTAEAVKAAPNVDLLGPQPIRYNAGDKLIELRTVFLLIRDRGPARD